MPHKLTLLTAALLLPAALVQAQTTFSIGPRVGLNVANVPFKDQDRTYNTKSRTGAEVGLAASVNFGHFAVQPALLYSQKGFSVDDTYTTELSVGERTITTLREKYRLNYFTVPLNLVYAVGKGGQGFQVSAGSYAGLLLGGKYAYDDRDVVIDGNDTQRFVDKSAGRVGVGNYYTTNRADTKFYSRGGDYGLQFGLGYRAGGALLQLGYSLGLAELGADFKVDYGRNRGGIKVFPGPTYRNRVVQASLSYLFGSKS